MSSSNGSLPMSGNAEAERVRRIQDRLALGADEGLPLDGRDDAAFGAAIRALEDAADDALLAPHRALGELAVGGEAGEARARSRAAGRAVVRVAGTEHEVAAIVIALRGRAEELDVVDLAAVAAGDARARERAADGTCEPRERAHLAQLERAVVGVDEEEPVAAPGDVTRHLAEALHLDVHRLAMPIGDDVLDRDLAMALERAGHGAHGRIEPVRARGDAPEVLQSGDDADGPVAAHAEVTRVIEVDDRGHGARLHRRHQDPADNHVGGARLGHDRAAVAVMPRAQRRDAIHHRHAGEVGKALEHPPRGLAAGVGNDVADALDRHAIYLPLPRFFARFLCGPAAGACGIDFAASAIMLHAHVAGFGMSPVSPASCIAFVPPLIMSRWNCSDLMVRATMLTLALSQCSTTSSSPIFLSSSFGSSTGNMRLCSG